MVRAAVSVGVLGVLTAAAGGCGRLGFGDGEVGAVDAGLGGDGALTDGTRTTTCGGHDEDGDGVGDSCDVCPSEPDPAQADLGELAAGAAADGVGDACDPRPAQSGDTIAFFDPFTSAPGAGYTTFGTAVTWDGADAVQLGTPTSSGLMAFTSTARFTRASWRVAIDERPTSGLYYVGLWSQYDTFGDAVFASMGEDIGPASSTAFNIKEATAGGPDRFSTFAFLATNAVAGDAFVVHNDTALATGGRNRLTATRTATGEVLTTDLDVTRAYRPSFALESANARTFISYVIVYAGP